MSPRLGLLHGTATRGARVFAIASGLPEDMALVEPLPTRRHWSQMRQKPGFGGLLL